MPRLCPRGFASIIAFHLRAIVINDKMKLHLERTHKFIKTSLYYPNSMMHSFLKY